MTKQEYDLEIKKIEQEAKTKKDVLTRNYVYSNNPYLTGDVISDHSITIKIESTKWSYNIGDPCVVYYGPVLKKDGTPRKDGAKDSIYQSSIIK